MEFAISDEARSVRARIGQEVDQLRLDSVLHVGTTTAHYLATDANGVRHLVEVLLDRCVPDAAARKTLLQQGRVGLRLRHPSRVALIGLGELGLDQAERAPATPYLIHAFAPGEPLDELVRRDGAFDLDSALAVASVALNVVVRAHRRGFVHGPLTLRKILVETADADDRAVGSVHVLDCGAVPWTRAARTFAGCDIDPRLDGATTGDVASLGLVLYALLAGERVAMVTPRRDRVVRAVESACDERPGGARVERLVARLLLRLLGLAGAPYRQAAEAESELDRIRALLDFTDGLAMFDGEPEVAEAEVPPVALELDLLEFGSLAPQRPQPVARPLEVAQLDVVAKLDAPELDAPELDAPELDVTEIDVTDLDALELDGVDLDAIEFTVDETEILDDAGPDEAAFELLTHSGERPAAPTVAPNGALVVPPVAPISGMRPRLVLADLEEATG